MSSQSISNNVIVIGSGPAAHTACIYLARSSLTPLMLEGDPSQVVAAGGLLTTTTIVENYSGFPQGIDGYTLTSNFREQSLRYGTIIKSETCVKIEKQDNDIFTIFTNSGDSYTTRSVIIATGSNPNKLDIQSYDEFWQRGVSTCAVCDGSLPCYRNVPIAVVGGGDSACEEALHLSKSASQVYLICRKDHLRASTIMSNRVRDNQKIKILFNAHVTQIKGRERVEELELYIDTLPYSLPVSGVFVAIGHTPNSHFIRELINCDQGGYIVTNRDMSTSVEGIWACGDVQDPKYRQAITAAGSGCVAALEVERWLTTR
jgi:thioredoxin reductase (NADPH)